MQLLAKNELTQTLIDLKKIINQIDFSNIKNIVFFNPESLFIYVNNLPKLHENNNPDGKILIEDILTKIELYIPFALCEFSLDYLIVSALSLRENEELVSEQFRMNMYIDFINYVIGINNEEDFKKLIDKFNDLRVEILERELRVK